jgi:CRISPR system Cascade subunit CasE
MFLSRLVLDMRDRHARRDVAAGYELHRTLVTRAFAESGVDPGRLLFRVEPMTRGGVDRGPVVLVQSSVGAPVLDALPSQYCLQHDGPRPYEPRFAEGMRLAFRLVANPVRRSPRVDDSGRIEASESGHVRHRRRGILDDDGQRAWLDRQALAGGFAVRAVTVSPLPSPRARTEEYSHERKSRLPHIVVRFDGVLEVTDPATLRSTIEQGIGAAKAFGCGLLSVRRI